MKYEGAGNAGFQKFPGASFEEEDAGWITGSDLNEQDDSGFEGDSRKILSVTAITRKIKCALEDGFIGVWISGELSNVRKPGSGHVYFTLKDDRAQLQAVAFRSVANGVKFNLEDGVEAIIYGSISVYEPRGQYQLIAECIEPKGVGALQLAFEQLKAKLEKEGLFDLRLKKELPFLPKRIAIVTSPTGAAIKDMENIINRRFPGVQILLYPVRVQGEGAAGDIAQAIYDVNQLDDIDVMIVGRGGGSIEDLWAFNEEVVARSIFASEITIISAVGHEIDVTISDFAADKRALTPSEAGEMVVPRLDQLLDALGNLKDRLNRSLVNRVEQDRNRLRLIAGSYAFRKPLERVYNLRQRLDDLTHRLNSGINHLVEMQKEKAANMAGRLEGLSPLGILARGYSITTKVGAAKPLITPGDLKKGDKITTRLSNGSLVSVIDEIN